MGGETSLIDYINAFNEFDLEINKIHNYNPLQDVYYEGYLVNYKRYQNFKILVNNLYNQQNKFNSTFNVNPTGSTNYNDILEQNRLTTESFPLVESRILNGESFIIINKKLFILICKKMNLKIIKLNIKLYQEIQDLFKLIQIIIKKLFDLKIIKQILLINPLFLQKRIMMV